MSLLTAFTSTLEALMVFAETADAAQRKAKDKAEILRNAFFIFQLLLFFPTNDSDWAFSSILY
jgi:hypothetical protein